MNIGTKITYIGITINLFIAAIIIITMFGGFNDLTDILSDWPLNLGIGILALYLSGKFIGNKMEFLIKTKKWNATLTGIIGLFTILLFGIIFGSTVGFIQEGLENIKSENGLSNALIDYYLKPSFWILFFGIIPTIIVGGIIGCQIKKVN
jgi:hypothetical protein